MFGLCYDEDIRKIVPATPPIPLPASDLDGMIVVYTDFKAVAVVCVATFM